MSISSRRWLEEHTISDDISILISWLECAAAAVRALEEARRTLFFLRVGCPPAFG